MNLTVALKPEEQLELAQLPYDCRKDVERWLGLFCKVQQAVGAGMGIVAARETVAKAAGIPVSTFNRQWFAFRDHGWEKLINRAKWPLHREAGLPPAFRDFVAGLYFAHQRGQTGREVQRKLVAQWRKWRAGDVTMQIPGYDSPPEPQVHTGVPAGWSKENIARLKPSKFSLITRRRGTMAAKEMLPNIIRTRVGLEFGSLYQIDDQDYDVYVNFEGINKKAMRPSGFNALEVLSGCHFAFCAKPLIYHPEDGTRSRLTEEDCAWFVLHVLTEHGYRADVGTTFMAEKGTAAIRTALAEGLARVTDGKVQVATSGILGGPMLEGLAFKGAPRGNFRFKGHIESSFALVRTIMAHLKGATGTRLTAPEENYALLSYNDKLLKWAEKLPPKRAQLLIKPVLSWQEFGQVNHMLMEMMNQRDWHELEGWEQCGFMTNEVRLSTSSDEWMSYEDVLSLVDDRAKELALQLMGMPGHGRMRKLSPREVFNGGRHQLTKLNRHLWNLCLPNEYATPTKVQPNHTIKIKDRAPGGGDLVYMARATNKHGRIEVLSPGDKLRIYANPFSPDSALVCDESDAAIGLVKLMPKAGILDADGAMRVHGSIEQFRVELEGEARAHAQGLVVQRQHMMEHNQAVMDGEPVTDVEVGAVKKNARAGRAAENLMDAAGKVSIPLGVAAGQMDGMDEMDPMDS